MVCKKSKFLLLEAPTTEPWLFLESRRQRWPNPDRLGLRVWNEPSTAELMLSRPLKFSNAPDFIQYCIGLSICWYITAICSCITVKGEKHLQNLIWSAGHSGDLAMFGHSIVRTNGVFGVSDCLLLVCTLWHFWQDNLRTRLSTGTHQLSKTLQLTTCKAGSLGIMPHWSIQEQVHPQAPWPGKSLTGSDVTNSLAAHTFEACLSMRSWLQFTWSHTSWNVDQHEICREFTCFHKNEDEKLLFMQSKDRPCAEIYKLHSIGN